ncbi:tryptophan halogenase [Shewanella sairae]|uniref:Tryptophan halogenase n=1 Tax=Shewanella sairae TaxID=190310 RepID=A0ABQ4PSA1_9GAMM|nr:tryptophan halogenase family protein [Shewanella sairae]MCL1130732.1 tryptophan 7-halogenase [Shewanella sairae]GIU52594.1 tryptophan halogenase [Shewanella sairae]
MEVERKVVIVGGGTSGWMAAAALANVSKKIGLHITLIESNEIGTIGVGEGSTPYLKRFMSSLGFIESEWMLQCDASFKTGIYFENWNGDDSRYFHPFYTSLDVKPAEVFFHCANARRRGVGPNITGDDFFLSTYLAKHHLSPASSSCLPVEPEYGYHFDAAKLSIVLKNYALNKGVAHVIDNVTHVSTSSVGIDALQLGKGHQIEADFFVDASGFKALLIGEQLEIPFESFANELKNDAAVAVSTVRDPNKPLNSYTQSTALSAGWMWQIPLTSRTGNGYVYSSEHLSKSEAENELAAKLGVEPSQVEFKHINMKVGMRRKPWSKNVVAVGLAHSFVEPLEATALMITQWGIEAFIKVLVKGNENCDRANHVYNQQQTRLVLGVKEYIHAHYLTSQRADSAYWQQVTSEKQVEARLAAILACWRKGEDFDEILFRYDAELAYFSPSWYALFAGMDYRDCQLKIPHEQLPFSMIDQAKRYVEQAAKTYFKPCKLANGRG